VAKPLKWLLESIIPQSLQWKIRIFNQWDDIIGNLKDKVWIEKIDGSILYLKVSHPTWAHELSLLSPMLTKKINALFPEKKISAIRLRSSMIEKKRIERKKKQKYVEPPTRLLNKTEKAMLKRLGNKELQSAFSAYFIKCKTIKRSL